MITPLAKFFDWLHIQRSSRRMPSVDGRIHRLEEALHFLKGPDFIPAESQPAPVQFDRGVNFSFATPRPSAFEENNIAYGWLYRCAERWQEKPVILLLHGGGLMRGRKSSLKYRFAYPMVARACNRAGFNAATLELPYNFQRHPRPPGAQPTHDMLRMAEAVGQAIAEIRALTGWFLAEGCPAVALCGTSMGAGLTGITLCLEPRIAAAVLTVPSVRNANPGKPCNGVDRPFLFPIQRLPVLGSVEGKPDAKRGTKAGNADGHRCLQDLVTT